MSLEDISGMCMTTIKEDFQKLLCTTKFADNIKGCHYKAQGLPL